MTDIRSRSLRTPVLILDCQTTGASPAHGCLLELGWAAGDDEACAEVVTLPDAAEIPPRIKRMTGVSDAEILSARRPLQVWEDIRKHHLVAGASRHAAMPVVIHYARFEKPWLDQLARGCGEETLLEPICTFEVARRLLPGLPSRSIRAIAGYLGQPMDELKRARHHVEATRFIWRELVDRLEAISIITFGDLEDWMASTKPQKPAKTTYALPIDVRLKLPSRPGVYLFKGSDGRILYVGKASSLKSRVNSYFRGRKTKGSRLNELRAQIQDVETRAVDSPLAAALLETDLIKHYDPQYNRALRQSERALLYCDTQLTPAVTPGQGGYGPIAQTNALLQLDALLKVAEAKPWPLAVFGLDQDIDQELVLEAISIFDQQSEFPLRRDTDNLRGMFAQALVQSITRDKERLRLALEAEDADESLEANAEDSNSDEEADAEPFVMTPPIFAAIIRSNISSLARHLFRVRWMQRLSHCDLFWTDSRGLWHHMQTRDAVPSFRLESKPPSAPMSVGTPMRRLPPCLAVFDRMGVLYTEILRLLKAEGQVILYPHDGRILQATDLKRLMYPGYFL